MATNTVVKVDEEANAGYLDLAPYRTRYAGIATRQDEFQLTDDTLKMGDIAVKTIIIDYDSNNRILGLELLPF